MIKTVSSVEGFSDKPTKVFKTGIDLLDESIGGGLRTREFCVLMAPTGVGKTTFMMRQAINAAQQGMKVLYISAGEQTQDEMSLRIKCMMAAVDYKGLSESDYTMDEDTKIKEVSKDKTLENIYIDTEEYWDHNHDDHLKHMINAHINNYKIDFVFIDYIGCYLADTADSQYSYLTHIASDLKHISDDMNVGVITAMQTNRVLNIELSKGPKNFYPSTIDKTFMADSVGPAVKATLCLAMFDYKQSKIINIFKNRLTGLRGYMYLELSQPEYKYRSIEPYGHKLCTFNDDVMESENARGSN